MGVARCAHADVCDGGDPRAHAKPFARKHDNRPPAIRVVRDEVLAAESRPAVDAARGDHFVSASAFAHVLRVGFEARAEGAGFAEAFQQALAGVDLREVGAQGT